MTPDPDPGTFEAIEADLGPEPDRNPYTGDYVETAEEPEPAPEPKEETPPPEESPRESHEIVEPAEEPEEPEEEPEAEGEGEKAEETTEPEEPTLYEVKAAGETQKVTLDDLKRGYQLHQGAEARLQEAAETKQKAEWIIDQAISNPLKTALQFMIAEKKIPPAQAQQQLMEMAIEYVTPYVQEQMMEPAEKASAQQRREFELERQEFTRQQKVATDTAAKASADVKTRELVTSAEKSIADLGLDKLGIQDPILKRNIFRTMHQHHESLGEDLSTDDAAKLVKSEIERTRREYLGGLKAEDIVEGSPEAVELARKAEIERVNQNRQRSTGRGKATTSSTRPSRRTNEPREPQSMRKLFDGFAPKS